MPFLSISIPPLTLFIHVDAILLEILDVSTRFVAPCPASSVNCTNLAPLKIDPFTRIIAGMVSTELHGLKIECLAREFHIFEPPSGQTCVEWAGEFVSVAGGYLSNPSATEACAYCQYSVGDEFYRNLGISFDTRSRDRESASSPR